MGNNSTKAFLLWMNGADNHVWSYRDLWEAACDYQRESDAQLCIEEKEKGWNEYKDTCDSLTEQIRNNK